MVRPATSRRGFVLIAVTFSILVLLGVSGFAVDLGRMYVAKSEAQAFCDAAALGAAIQLDGTVKGITGAKAAVASAYQLPWNMGRERLGTPVVDFSTGLANTFSTDPVSPVGYKFARVRTSMPVNLYLLPAVVNSTYGTVAAKAVAAQIAVTRFEQGLAPFTVVSTDDTSPELGLIRGNEYSLQWPQYNGSRHGCSTNPANCFVSPPCSGDPPSSLSAVSQHWGASTNGYWGSNQNSEIAAEVLGLVQTSPIAIGDLITMSSGNKNVEGQILDRRVNQDRELVENTGGLYFNSTLHNGRRLVGVPVTKPTASGTYVTGFAAFLLISSGPPTSTYYTGGSGNDPFCAVYVGPYVIGSSSSGASTGTGAYRVSLVQ
ncbi:MAG TPA: pilus assembly protein TadG-related protein [Bryobacteraceae bacterium]|nr:pilus assembly protein TadG-related protein [Bryobacteraceae bacterium]